MSASKCYRYQIRAARIGGSFIPARMLGLAASTVSHLNVSFAMAALAYGGMRSGRSSKLSQSSPRPLKVLLTSLVYSSQNTP